MSIFQNAVVNLLQLLWMTSQPVQFLIINRCHLIELICEAWDCKYSHSILMILYDGGWIGHNFLWDDVFHSRISNKLCKLLKNNKARLTMMGKMLMEYSVNYSSQSQLIIAGKLMWTLLWFLFNFALSASTWNQEVEGDLKQLGRMYKRLPSSTIDLHIHSIRIWTLPLQAMETLSAHSKQPSTDNILGAHNNQRSHSRIS